MSAFGALIGLRRPKEGRRRAWLALRGRQGVSFWAGPGGLGWYRCIMKVATAAYPLDPVRTWSDYAAKLTDWVQTAVGQGADLLVFPEYGAMELSMLSGPVAAGDAEGCLHAVSSRIADVDDLHADLATRYGVHILAASAPVFDDAIGPRPVNRARLFSPTGGRAAQDKQIMTRFERDPWDIATGGPLQIFDTRLGKMAVLICYDSEFPLLARAVSETDLILAPSCTEALTGYWRVRIGAMARALEQQCVSVMASLVGNAPWAYGTEEDRKSVV